MLGHPQYYRAKHCQTDANPIQLFRHVPTFFSMSDLLTSKFQEACAYAVLPVSPALAALYTNKSLYSSKSRDWCSKCGSYLLNGTAEIRLKSQKRRHPSRRAIRITCGSCGWGTDTHTGSGISTLLPSDHIPPVEPSPLSSSLSSSSLPSPLSTPPLVAQIPSPSSAQQKSRNKKKSGLQVLLSRNREKEAQKQSDRKDNQMSGGLAAFLSGL